MDARWALEEETPAPPPPIGQRPAPPDRPSDEELLAAFYRGDDAALDHLMARYDWLGHLVLSRLPYRAGARVQRSEDLVQVTWVKVMDSRSRCTARWRAECGPVRPWLMQIVSNCVVDADRNDATAPLCRRQPADVADPAQEDLFVRCELRAAVAVSLGALEELESVVVVLKFWVGMQQNEIARVLALSEATICPRWATARRSCGRPSRQPTGTRIDEDRRGGVHLMNEDRRIPRRAPGTAGRPIVSSGFEAVLHHVAAEDRLEATRLETELGPTGGCLSLARHRRTALRHDWSPRERLHVDGCRRCTRTYDNVAAAVWHPEVTSLAGSLVGRLSADDGQALQHHLDGEGCQGCLRLLRSPAPRPGAPARR